MLSQDLKISTGSIHRAAEKIMIGWLRKIRTMEDYVVFLNWLYAWYGPLEDRIKSLLTKDVFPDMDRRTRADDLLRDMEGTGMPLPAPEHCPDLPLIDTFGKALGALYVIEGSTLGGRVIAGMLARQLGSEKSLSYFNSYGNETEGMWQSLSSSPNYDSEFCGKVPIHLINTVQSYGVLLVLERATLKVVQASENVEDLFRKPVTDVIQTSIGDYLDTKALTFLQQVAVTDKVPQVWTIGGQQYPVLIHVKEKLVLAEVDLTPYSEDTQRSFVSIFQEIKYSMSLINAASTTTVIAEAMQPRMEPYMGFTFPASDIPRQARDLYLKNPYRFIPDRLYQSVRLHPVMNPLTRGFIDLSDCNVRGVAAVHLEYLANMEVTASMSTRILHNDKLWGLIACHHRTVKHMSFELCSVFELLSQVISSRIFSLQNKESHELTERIQGAYTRLIGQVYDQKDIRQGLLEGDTTLLQLFDAQGASLTLEYVLIFRAEVKRVIDWGGNPGRRIVFEKDEKNYHPRHSFKLWREIVSGASLPWKEEELAIGTNLRSFLYELTNK